jgi:hypothetical protein
MPMVNAATVFVCDPGVRLVALCGFSKHGTDGVRSAGRKGANVCWESGACRTSKPVGVSDPLNPLVSALRSVKRWGNRTKQGRWLAWPVEGQERFRYCGIKLPVPRWGGVGR